MTWLATPAANKLANLLLASDMAYHLAGTPHAVFLMKHRHKYRGQARKEIEKLIALGDDISEWMKIFFEEIKNGY